MSYQHVIDAEGDAWEAVWCHLCANDSPSDRIDGQCEIAMALYVDPDNVPVEIREQPEGEYYLPPLHVCTKFAPCDGVDPRADERARVIAHLDKVAREEGKQHEW